MIGVGRAAGHVADTARTGRRFIDAGFGDGYIVLGSGHEMSMLATAPAFNSTGGELFRWSEIYVDGGNDRRKTACGPEPRPP